MNKNAFGLGDDFLKSIDTALDSIRQHPTISSTIYKNIRRKYLRRFPYGIIYTTSETTITVIAVVHAKRYPGRWQKRK